LSKYALQKQLNSAKIPSTVSPKLWHCWVAVD